MTERTIDAPGEHLLEPRITIEGCWITPSDNAATVIDLYADHSTSKEFQSEFKTDPDTSACHWANSPPTP